MIILSIVEWVRKIFIKKDSNKRSPSNINFSKIDETTNLEKAYKEAFNEERN